MPDNATADYANWMPKGMLVGAAVRTGVLLVADAAAHVAFGRFHPLSTALTVGTALGAVTTAYFYALRKAFDYNGKRQVSRRIIEGIADYVTIPDGGTGLDVGCGSGALAIACAKRNPNAEMVGCDIWDGAYKGTFSQAGCERNAKTEGVSNVRFEHGDAMKLPFADESFDAVTSNYVYHNVMGHDRQELLLETLRVLKKGGTFALHDLMSPMRYGDMEAFARKLKAQGFEDVRVIDTTDGAFMTRAEAMLLGLGSSKLLVGRK